MSVHDVPEFILRVAECHPAPSSGTPCRIEYHPGLTSRPAAPARSSGSTGTGAEPAPPVRPQYEIRWVGAARAQPLGRATWLDEADPRATWYEPGPFAAPLSWSVDEAEVVRASAARFRESVDKVVEQRMRIGRVSPSGLRGMWSQPAARARDSQTTDTYLNLRTGIFTTRPSRGGGKTMLLLKEFAEAEEHARARLELIERQRVALPPVDLDPPPMIVPMVEGANGESLFIPHTYDEL